MLDTRVSPMRFTRGVYEGSCASPGRTGSPTLMFSARQNRSTSLQCSANDPYGGLDMHMHVRRMVHKNLASCGGGAVG